MSVWDTVGVIDDVPMKDVPEEYVSSEEALLKVDPKENVPREDVLIEDISKEDVPRENGFKV